MDIDKYIKENAERKSHLQAINASSASPEWYTPKSILNLVYNVLGEIDLDPCSNPGVPNVIAKNHYTLNTDGLKHPWKGVVFMNPPYGKTIKLWTNKLEEEYQNKNVTRAIALVPARVDTKWYQKIAKHTVCFLNGRIKFELNGVQSNPSIFPSVAIYLGTDDKLFIETFKTKGSIYRAVIP